MYEWYAGPVIVTSYHCHGKCLHGSFGPFPFRFAQCLPLLAASTNLAKSSHSPKTLSSISKCKALFIPCNLVIHLDHQRSNFDWKSSFGCGRHKFTMITRDVFKSQLQSMDDLITCQIVTSHPDPSPRFNWSLTYRGFSLGCNLLVVSWGRPKRKFSQFLKAAATFASDNGAIQNATMNYNWSKKSDKRCGRWLNGLDSTDEQVSTSSSLQIPNYSLPPSCISCQYCTCMSNPFPRHFISLWYILHTAKVCTRFMIHQSHHLQVRSYVSGVLKQKFATKFWVLTLNNTLVLHSSGMRDVICAKYRLARGFL